MIEVIETEIAVAGGCVSAWRNGRQEDADEIIISNSARVAEAVKAEAAGTERPGVFQLAVIWTPRPSATRQTETAHIVFDCHNKLAGVVKSPAAAVDMALSVAEMSIGLHDESALDRAQKTDAALDAAFRTVKKGEST